MLGFDCQQMQKFPSSPTLPDRLYFQLSHVSGSLYPEIKQPESKAGHSPPSNAEVKNIRSLTSTISVPLYGETFYAQEQVARH
jgi:hypothetical protein